MGTLLEYPCKPEAIKQEVNLTQKTYESDIWRIKWIKNFYEPIYNSGLFFFIKRLMMRFINI